MRGYPEESAEVRARRSLLEAARQYAAAYLAGGFATLPERERLLEGAADALALAKAPPRTPPKKRKRKASR